MGEQNWSIRDLTGIKPRRPEGAGECVDDWDQTSLYLIWPQLGNSLVRTHLQRECQFDFGNNMHVKMDSMTMDQSLPSDGLKDFEFNMSATLSERVCPSEMSSADELFFKGQLLPLHLPPRLRMVQKLAAEKQLESESNGIPAAQTSQPRVRRSGFLPKYSKLWMHNPDLLSSADGTVPDSGIARFRGHSWLDPEERDSSTDSCRNSTSGRDSSSSRDSTGSSQDASFPDRNCKDIQMPTSTDLKSNALHNREVFGMHRRFAVERPTISSWLRPAFKWKVLFGAKKVATTSGTTRSGALVDQKPGQRPPVGHVSEESTSYSRLDAKCSDATDSLCGMNHCGDLSLQIGNLELYPRGFERASILSSDADKDQGGMAKAREYLQKYMKILKPLHLKYDQNELDQESCRAGSFSLPSSSLAHESRRQSRSISGSRSFSSFSQSLRFASTGVSPRLQPASGTPALGGGGRQLSNGSISELHSAVQSAIAHCKESQSAAKNERASRSQHFASSMAVRRRTESNL